jgi:hypothetical protein
MNYVGMAFWRRPLALNDRAKRKKLRFGGAFF